MCVFEVNLLVFLAHLIEKNDLLICFFLNPQVLGVLKVTKCSRNLILAVLMPKRNCCECIKYSAANLNNLLFTITVNVQLLA